ncbi:hypothetical protein D3C75_829480 [compost metagenome]
MRFNAMLAVWLLAWVRGFLSAGNTYSLWPLWGLSVSSNASACSVSGMVCGRRFFMRSGGMVQMRLSKSMSAHRVVAASTGRVIVCNCHSIRQRVTRLMLAFAISIMSSGSSSGRSAAMFSFLGFLNTARMPLRGFAKISPELTP